MKKQILRFLSMFIEFAFFSASCTKSSTYPPLPQAKLQGMIKFTANGTNYDWKENNNLSSPDYFAMGILKSPGSNEYELTATSKKSFYLPGSVLTLYMHTPSLTLTTYIWMNSIV